MDKTDCRLQPLCKGQYIIRAAGSRPHLEACMDACDGSGCLALYARTDGWNRDKLPPGGNCVVRKQSGQD